MKKCTKCGETKCLTKFGKNNYGKDGVKSICKTCACEYYRKYYLENKEKIRESDRKYKLENKEKISKYRKKYKLENKEKISKSGKKYYLENKERINKSGREYYLENKERITSTVKEYYKNNKGVHRAKDAKRRATKLNATPEWLTDRHIKDIKNVYAKAKLLEEKHGVKYHVDHIVPLRGNNVCGLHVPWNLQVLTEEENLHKSNSYNDWSDVAYTE